MPLPAFSTADPNAYLAIGMQSALNVPQTAASKLRFCKYISGNAFSVNPQIVDLREGGDGLDFGIAYKTRIAVEGTLVFNLRPEMAGQFFQILPGGATWNAASAPALHTFHDNHASHPYSTIFSQHPGSTLQNMLTDVRFTGVTIEAVTGQPIKVSAPFMALTYGASYTAITPTYYGAGSDGLGANDDFWLYHTTPSVQLDGVADSTIERWSLSQKLGTEELQAQSVFLDDIPVFSREWDFSLERRYQSTQMYSKIISGGAVSPTTSVPTGAFRADYTYGGAGVKNRTISFSAPILTYRDDNITELDPDGKTVKETITAKPLRSASSTVTITVSNAHASAYAP